MISRASAVVKDGGAGTGGARGVEEVDVEGQEGLGVTDALDDLLDNGLHAQLVGLVGLDDRVAEVGGVGEILGTIEALADADLDGVGGVDQALLGGVIERGAVGVGLAEVLVDGVVVGIEVDEGHGAVGLSADAQLRQGDGVVAAHGHGDDALLEDGAHAILDDLEGVLDVARDGAHITKVDAGALIKDADVQRAGVGLCGEGRHLTDGGRPCLQPTRNVAQVSNGMPMTTKSTSSRTAGSSTFSMRMKVLIPEKRGDISEFLGLYCLDMVTTLFLVPLLQNAPTQLVL